MIKTEHKPKYPMYIISKGRWDTRWTSKALEALGLFYYIVVESSERREYVKAIGDRNKVLLLPESYLNEYDTCDNLGRTKSTGPGAARNFCWDHAIKNKHRWHWVMDDNISGFMRVNHNTRIRVATPAIFRAAEDFVERYQNVAIAGFQYDFFLKAKSPRPPFYLNTRIYSCLLIRNDIPYRWRGRYNEDTDLSLRVLKDGWCTIEFNAFLQEKATTQLLSGGNTEEFYKHEGTFNKSKMLQEMHPDVSRVIQRYGRDHHYVDYSVFKKNKLKRKIDIEIPTGINNYGMILDYKELK